MGTAFYTLGSCGFIQMLLLIACGAWLVTAPAQG